jgi:4-amino-4-deoxy-L-arabinose transferase-like glycosyltransferase
VAVALILAIGCFLRLPPFAFESEHSVLHRLLALHPAPKFQQVGFDEGLYLSYEKVIIAGGLGAYPQLADGYLDVQRGLKTAILPPTRVLYLYSAYLWHEAFGSEALVSLKVVSSIFSMLLLGLATLFAWRLGGHLFGLCVAALMAFAPTQIHMSQHALIDGFFAFWATLALWLLWENLQRPNRRTWLSAYGIALAAMVLTKENAAFAYAGLLGLLAANYWLRFGKVTPNLLLFTILGPLVGVLVLIGLCGGLATTIAVFRIFVSKVSLLPYAIETGDGPWYRYLIDLMTVSPLILLLAIGGVFRLRLTNRPALFLCVFLATSFLLMANIPYGMNLRYANLWDFPLRYLAAGCLLELTDPLGNWRRWWLGLAILLVCATELRQYRILFVQNDLYELIPREMLKALKILK